MSAYIVFPYPNTDPYSVLKYGARAIQGAAIFTALNGSVLLMNKRDSLATITGVVSAIIGVSCITAGAGLAIIGHDIHQISTNMENVHKDNFDTAIPHPPYNLNRRIDSKKAINDITEKLWLKNVIRHYTIENPKFIDDGVVVLQHKPHVKNWLGT